MTEQFLLLFSFKIGCHENINFNLSQPSDTYTHIYRIFVIIITELITKAEEIANNCNRILRGKLTLP
jgi:hypothetical protein